MIAIDEEFIKRVENGDLIVKGFPEEILQSKYEDGWCIVANLRETEELAVERSGIFADMPTGITLKRKISYSEI